MEFQSKVMDSIAEWIAATNPSRNLFSAANGVQSQALSLTTYSSGGPQNNSSDCANNAGKTISVRCIVESLSSVQYWDMSQNMTTNGHVELKKTVNVPIHTIFYNLVDVVLKIFGYPKEIAMTARGFVLIDNWRPLRLEKVPINPEKTVIEVLGEINSFVTLRIQVLKSATVFSRMKDRLLQVLLQQNRDLILNSGCPLDQITLKNILDGNDYNSNLTLSEDMVAKFEQWMINQSRQAVRRIAFPSSLPQFHYHLGSATAFPYDKGLQTNVDEKVHPAMQTIQNQYPTQKTRMRTSFDPELEIPKLQKWFSENQHPSKQQIVQYVNELNNLESRKGRKPLDVNNVVYWFKNARAAQKRAEVRNMNSGQVTSLNGYHSNSHSPCDTAANSKESLGSVQSCDEDDIDDDDNRSERDVKEESLDAQPSGSPVAPLSLTTHRENDGSRNSSPILQMKQEPPDKGPEVGGDGNGVVDYQKLESRDSPVDQQDFESDDDMTDEDDSDTEEAPKGGSILETDSGKSPSSPSPSPSLFSSSSPLTLISRSAAANNAVFPLVPNSVFTHPYPIFGVSHFMPNMTMAAARNAATMHTSSHANNHSSSCGGGGVANAGSCGGGGGGGGGGGSDERRNKRNRTFIDPVSEVPRLEKWYKDNSHPTQSQILQYAENLNGFPYRSKFPKLEPKNVQFWFKNRRAKEKRLKTSMYEGIGVNNNLSSQDHFQLAVALSADNYRGHD